MHIKHLLDANKYDAARKQSVSLRSCLNASQLSRMLHADSDLENDRANRSHCHTGSGKQAKYRRTQTILLLSLISKRQNTFGLAAVTPESRWVAHTLVTLAMRISAVGKPVSKAIHRTCI